MKVTLQNVTKIFPSRHKKQEQDEFIKEMRASYQHKFAKKPEVIEGNMNALTMTLDALAPAMEELKTA